MNANKVEADSHVMKYMYSDQTITALCQALKDHEKNLQKPIFQLFKAIIDQVLKHSPGLLGTRVGSIKKNGIVSWKEGELESRGSSLHTPRLPSPLPLDSPAQD